MQRDIADPCVCSIGRAREESGQENGYRDLDNVRAIGARALACI